MQSGDVTVFDQRADFIVAVPECTDLIEWTVLSNISPMISLISMQIKELSKSHLMGASLTCFIRLLLSEKQ